jgi:glycerophosphoryl diester phosphodiesterase
MAGHVPRRVEDLPTPFFIAHRGMANVYPENTLEAYRGSVASGVDVVETDCWLTGDGWLVCLHDATLDRTTTGSGLTQELTASRAAGLRVDAGAWFAAGWPNSLRVPAFSEVLEEVGGRAVLCPEAKNAGAGRAIVDGLARKGLKDKAILQSFMGAELGPAISSGGEAMALVATSSFDPATLRAAGIGYLGLSAALPAALARSATAAGLRVAVWVVDRRADAEPWLSAGAVGFFSDDPLYLSGRSRVLERDPYARSSYYHGHLASAVAGDRGVFYPPDGWGYADTAPSYKGALQGWACPVNGTSPGPVTITISMRMSATDPSGWAGAFVCASDDRSFDDAGRRDVGMNGYHVLLRQSGSLELYVVTDGIPHLAAEAATASIDQGGQATVRIDVTGTELVAARVDVPRPVAVTVADATHRGSYFHLGRRAAAVCFSGVTIT